ncbi:hypothetical protein ACGFI9_12110 [Micromonospora sp. NPDC048930]|uniref:hypothetical protein n=1 Tax=Micromonospora sp. NPDC048930 TaxID=3364261 RepID=UPI003716252D
MAKPLQLDVLGEDRSAKRVLKDTADGLDRVADKADKADDHLRGAAGGAGKLTGEIAKTEAAIKKLSEEFDRTGDRGLFKQLSKQQRELSVMLKLRDQLDAPLIKTEHLDEDVDKHTSRFGARLLDSVDKVSTKVTGKVAGILGDSVANLPPQAQAGIAGALVGGATVAAPLLGATVGAAVVSGIGAAGIGVGIAAALQDPAVAEAIGGVGGRLKQQLANALGGDYAGPTVRSIERLEQAAGNLLGQTKDELADLAPVLEEVVDGAAEMVERMGPGLEDALRASGPMLRVLGRELPELGDDISDFFSSVAKGRDGEILALVTVLDLAGEAIKGFGNTIAGLAFVYEGLIGGTQQVTGVVRELTNDIPLVGDAADWVDQKFLGLMADAGLLGGEMEDLAKEHERAAKAALDQANKLDTLASAEQGVRMSTLDFKDGLAELSDSVQHNGTSLDENSEKGRANLRVIESLITESQRAGKAAEQRALAEGQSAEAAAAAGARMREGFIADLISAADKAGLSKKRIQEMVAELRKADGERIQIYIDQNLRRFGKPYTEVTGIGGNSFRGMSSGGPVGGGGPAGVDTQPRILASDEWVATGRGHQALLAAFGPGGLDELNRTGVMPSGGAAAAGAGGAAAAAAAGGGPLEVTLRAILQYPDGSVIAEQVTRHANRSGLGTLDAVFGIPAAA